MSRRVRDRGPRRRCASSKTLVRTRPAVNVPPPPIPLGGLIYRMMTPAAIADYEGLATASWSSGSTGTINGVGNSAWQCLYYHVVQTNPAVPYEVILPPVRWSVVVPASSGGSYDLWSDLSPARTGYSSQPAARATGSSGQYGLAKELMPAGHFAEFENGFCQLESLQTFAYASWREASLQAIAPTVLPSTNGPVATIAAIRHRVNGVAVGTLQLNPIGTRSQTTAWRFNVAKGDTYEIDVWLRFRMPVNSSFSGNPLKGCILIPQYRLFNSSKMITPVITSIVGFTPLATFGNINFSPAFNYKDQTYQVSIAGHSGWTLKDGSNGPHKMITGENWQAGIDNGFVVWKYVPANGYCNAIVFRWDRELPHVEFYPGPLSSAWGGSSNATPPFIFRPPHSGYLSSSTSADFGFLTHIDAGTINQAGTTTFNRQNIQDARPSVFSGLYYDAGFAEAFDSVGVFIAPHIPTSITLSRVSR